MRLKLSNLLYSFFVYICSVLLIFQSCLADGQENTILLDAEEVAKIALNNNFDIQIYNLDRLISEQDLVKSKAVYDTEFTGEYEYAEDRLARSSTLVGKRETTVYQELNAEKTLPTGTILSMGLTHKRDYTDSVFATLNPHHESTAEISVTQPLLKDFFGIQTRNPIKIAALDRESVAYTSAEKIEETIALAQKAYWRLVLAYHEVGIGDQILSSAQKLSEVTKKNFELGTVIECAPDQWLYWFCVGALLALSIPEPYRRYNDCARNTDSISGHFLHNEFYGANNKPHLYVWINNHGRDDSG